MEAKTQQAREQARALAAKAWRSELREAVVRGDTVALLALLGGRALPIDALQLVGDGLGCALSVQVQVQVPGAAPRTEQCAAALRRRGWRGDPELADQLEGLLGTRAAPILCPLPVSLEELAMLREGDPRNGGGRVDLRTGRVWPAEASKNAGEPGEATRPGEAQDLDTEDPDTEDPDTEGLDTAGVDRWLWIENADSRPGYRDMTRFLATVTGAGRAEQLAVAIDGPGAFRRFKDVLARWPEEFQRWHAFTDERRYGRARAWLAAAGYAVAHPGHPGPADPPAATTGSPPPTGPGDQVTLSVR